MTSRWIYFARAHVWLAVLCIGARGGAVCHAQSDNSAPDPAAASKPVAASQPAFEARGVAYEFSTLDAKIDELLKETKLPGAGVLVIKDGAVVHERYFGAYSKDTVVSIASASKWLAGATLMSVVDRGQLKLDDPVSKYIAEFGGDKAAITVRMLFNHTHGLPPDNDAAIRIGRGTLAEAATRIAKLGMSAKPGRVFHYGSVGMQVGGRVAEIASGKAWRELFAERITMPLHMEHTQFGRLGRSRNPLIAGGASSTLRDYANFLRMVLADGEFEGQRVLSKAVARELVADHTRDAGVAKTALGRAARARGYGVGCWVERQDRTGETIGASSPGKFGFRPWIDRERNLIAIFMIEDRAGLRHQLTSGFDVVAEVNRAIDQQPRKSDRSQAR